MIDNLREALNLGCLQTCDEIPKLHERIAYLEEKVAEKDEQIAGLRHELKWDRTVPVCFRLTPKEQKLLLAIMSRHVLTHEKACNAIYWERPSDKDLPSEHIISVFICKMRHKLRRYGIEIQSRWGVGFHLPPDSRRIIDELLAREGAKS